MRKMVKMVKRGGARRVKHIVHCSVVHPTDTVNSEARLLSGAQLKNVRTTKFTDTINHYISQFYV